MRKLLFVPIILLLLAACAEDDYSDVWTYYAGWRQENDEWIQNQAKRTNPDGTLYYNKVVPSWNPNAYVLMHYFNDRNETKDNLVPMYTSTVSVKYQGKLITDTIFDSSYSLPDSLFTTTLGSVIQGWSIALQDMHVGDSCEVLIPYQQAYYTSGSGLVLPFSCLKFGIKLVDIPYYEIKP